MNRAIVLFQPYELFSDDDDSVFFDHPDHVDIDTRFLLVDNDVHECTLCMSHKKMLIRTEQPNKTLSLQEAPTLLDIDCLVYGPCYRHMFCTACLRKVLTDEYHHPINDQHALVACLSPFETCANEDGHLYYFNHHDIEKILNNTEFRQYMDRAERFAFPGFQMLKCAMCQSGILVESEAIQGARRGTLIIACDQSRYCARRICYFCERSVGLANECQRCLQSSEHEDPQAFNHYFYKPQIEADLDTVVIKQHDAFFYRNGELTVPLVIERLLEICGLEEPPVKCFGCNVFLKKSEACNTLEHCDFEICYACGRSSFRHGSLGDHWSEHGHLGCPRFDMAPYWNETAQCEYVCPFFSCTSHSRGECTMPSHQPGIQKYHKTRKQALVYHALKSLLAQTRQDVFAVLQENHPEVPLPDPTLFDTLDKHPSWRSHYSALIVQAFLASLTS